MGCMCCKPSAIEDSKESPRERLSSKPSSDLRVSRATSSRREEAYRAKDQYDSNDGRTMLIDKQVNGSLRVHGGEHVDRKRDKSEYAVLHHPGMGSIPKATEGEQVAAGWPSWLAAVAGEAIKGWLPRRADSFEKLDKIGQGTYSNVYRARDLDQKKIVALKKVRFDNLEPESVRFMAREIHILRRLDHPNVIKLEGLVTSRMSCSLYLVFEYMEHDLAGLASHPGLNFTEAQVKCYMQQLLRGLDHCHSRGVLHRDIKGSNLLIDNNGILKIADFGLASFYDPAQVQPLTSRVVTLWYRPPELLLGATYYGIAVDLWSTGCILAELYAGKPIMPGRTEVEQLHKIFKLCGSPSEDYWRKAKLPHATIFKPQQPYRRCVAETFKEFPAPALALMETLLAIDPADRGSAASALRSEFFTTKPLPCDPSSLPDYPPSKEFDAKMRDEEARRQFPSSPLQQRKSNALGFNPNLPSLSLAPMAAEQDDTVFDQDLEVDDEDEDDQSSQSQNDDLEDDLEIENDDTLPENDDVLSEELLEDDDTSTSAAVPTAIPAVTIASIPAVTTTTTAVASDSTPDVLKRQRAPPDTTIIPSQDSKKPQFDDTRRLFQRLWTDEDEIELLQGFLDYTTTKGTVNNHHNDTALFYDQIKSKLQLDFNKNQLVEKLRRLKKKYRNVLNKINSGKDFCFKSPHDQATFEISRKIWSSTGKIAGFGSEDGHNLDDDDGGNPNPNPNPNLNNHNVMMDADVAVKIEDQRSTPRSRKRSRSRPVVGVRTEEKRVLMNDGFVGNETNVNGGGSGNGNLSSVIEETMRSCLSPLFKELLSNMAGAGMGGVGRGVGGLAMNAMPLSFGVGDVMMMDEKWRKQHILELEVYSKRLELVQDQIRAQLDELRSMGV